MAGIDINQFKYEMINENVSKKASKKYKKAVTEIQNKWGGSIIIDSLEGIEFSMLENTLLKDDFRLSQQQVEKLVKKHDKSLLSAVNAKWHEWDLDGDGLSMVEIQNRFDFEKTKPINGSDTELTLEDFTKDPNLVLIEKYEQLFVHNADKHELVLETAEKLKLIDCKNKALGGFNIEKLEDTYKYILEGGQIKEVENTEELKKLIPLLIASRIELLSNGNNEIYQFLCRASFTITKDTNGEYEPENNTIKIPSYTLDYPSDALEPWMDTILHEVAHAADHSDGVADGKMSSWTGGDMKLVTEDYQLFGKQVRKNVWNNYLTDENREQWLTYSESIEENFSLDMSFVFYNENDGSYQKTNGIWNYAALNELEFTAIMHQYYFLEPETLKEKFPETYQLFQKQYNRY